METLMETLKKDREFKEVYNHRRFVADRLLVLYAKKNYLPKSRLGVSVSRKVGKAVVRNKVKRLIKEQTRQLSGSGGIATGYDLVALARVPAAEASYAQIGQSLFKLFKKLKLDDNRGET